MRVSSRVILSVCELNAMISPQMPLEGLPLSNITGNCTVGISDANLRNIKVTGYTGALVMLANVQDSGLEIPR
jgi:hypothetical protein